MTTEAFGPAAQRLASGLEGIPAVVADDSAAAQALAACVRRRRNGEAFYSSLALDDSRMLVACEYALGLYASQMNEDQRRRLFDAIALEALTVRDVSIEKISTFSREEKVVLQDVAMMGDGLLVRSWAEAERLTKLFVGRRRDFVVRFPGVDDTVPQDITFASGDAIVVWAPNLGAHHAGIYAYALKDFFLPVLLAFAQIPQFRLPNVEFVVPTADVLRRAAVVIDASAGGPASAIALARRGFPLAVTTVSGAAEYMVGAVPYEPWSWRSIQAATQRALAASAPIVHRVQPSSAEIASELEESRSSIPRDGELVSVVMPTYNRRQWLVHALESVARQTYRNIEMIVVNDGGEPVGDLVARYPNAMMIEHERNQGIVAATNTAFRAARGTYITFCCDDDLLYPDAIARWVQALSRSKARVVNGNTVMRFDRRTETQVVTTGYRMMWKENVDHRDSLYTPFTPLSCVLFHRDVLDKVGYYQDSIVCDTEFLLRISRQYDYLHVDQPCVELEYDTAKGQGKEVGMSRRAEALRVMFEQYPSDSADVAEGRRVVIDWHHQKQEEGSYFKPELELPEPEVRAL